MASWTSLAVLSALAVSTLSLPGPDGAYNIPQVGTGRRSQYYVLHNDGTYKYGHDTGEGAFESAKLKSPGDLEGEFGYRDPDGNNINVQYKSGEGGFVARGNHLPVPHPDFDAAHAEARARPDFVDPLANSNTDASYNFQFAGEELSRSEQSDPNGNVRGSYTYTDEEGVTRTYTYTAGRGIGFVIEGSDLPQGPPESGLTPAATRFSSGTPSRTISSQFSSGSQRVGTAAQFSSGSQRVGTTPQFSSGSQSVGTAPSASRRPSGATTSTLNRSTLSSFRPRTPARPSVGATQTGFRSTSSQGNTGSDGSYSFSYNAGDHSRSESADANLNVAGQFSFTADDGVQRSVTYESGANRGFQATGDHLPTPPESDFGNRISSTRRVQSTYQANSASRPATPARPATALRTPSIRPRAQQSQSTNLQSTFQTPSIRTPAFPASRPQTVFPSSQPQSTFHKSPVRGSTTSTLSSPSRPLFTRQSQTSSSSSASPRVPFEEANTRSEARPDGSYSFAYETSSHSRAESGDSDNNVDGKFDFVADDDGQRREIKYEAGSDTGFIAEGAHIPVGPEVPGAPSGQPTGRIVPVQEIPFEDPLANTGLDASYNFAFDSEQYSRSEVADAEGNVQGSYTVVDDDGTRRTYQFRAGKGVGFETEEVSVSQGPPPTRQNPSLSVSNTAGSTTSFRGASSPSFPSSAVQGIGASSHSTYQGTRSSPSTNFHSSGTFSTTSVHGAGAQPASQFRASSSSATNRGGSGLRSSSFGAPATTLGSRPATSSFSTSSNTPLRSSFTPVSTQEVFPGFQLHQYDASKNPEKFGYVLTFD